MQLDLPDHLSERRRRTLTATAVDLESRFGDGLSGLVLSGSAGRGTATVRSDLDLIVVMTPDIVNGPSAPWLHTDELELIPQALDQVRTLAPFGSAGYAYRWSWAWAPVLLDRTGGSITAAVERQACLDVGESVDVLVGCESLGRWLNLTFRALKSARAGRSLETRVDAVESLPVFLDIVFALEGLVRPYGSYLTWTLEHHPLTGWPDGLLLELVRRILDGDTEAVRAGVTEVERRALRFADQHDRPAIRETFDEWRPDDYGTVLGLRRPSR